MKLVVRCRIKELAERRGFEPPVDLSTYDGLANRCFRPLSHLSARRVSTSWRMVTHKPVRGETDCPGSRKGAGNVKCSPVRVSIYEPCYSQGDVHGRIRFKRHRNRQNLCDWILESGAFDVKGKTFRPFFPFNRLIRLGLMPECKISRLWKTCDKALKFGIVSSLRARTI